MKKLKLIFMLFQIAVITYSQILNLPPRIDSAMTGSEFAQLVWNFSRVDREDEIYAQVISGNVPEFQRNLIPITFSQTINSTAYNVTYYVLPDYLAIGCDTNYFLIPMTPIVAQKICNKIGYTMTT
ncbi:MAG: hypothetical protein JXA68_01935, partial [Ignavibacteriales bacterium]|nr:hypothetical protein [Ignavibacteriales bacterium]